MRSLVLAFLLLAFTARAARAEEDSPGGGMDHGAVAALVGGIALAIAYPATAIAANVGDSLCSLNYDNPSCNTNPHASLEIPLVGGFLYSGPDRALPILSSVVQIGATGLIVGGLAVHKWSVKSGSR